MSTLLTTRNLEARYGDFQALFGRDSIGLEMGAEPLPDPEEEDNRKVVMFVGPED